MFGFSLIDFWSLLAVRDERPKRDLVFLRQCAHSCLALQLPTSNRAGYKARAERHPLFAEGLVLEIVCGEHC